MTMRRVQTVSGGFSAVFLFGAVAMAQVSEETIVAIWLCDDGEGALLEDASGNGHDGVFAGGEATWTDDGIFDGALLFPGERGSHFEVEHADELSLERWTVTSWAKLQAPPEGDWAVLVVKDPANGVQNYSLDLNQGGQVFAEVTNGGAWSNCGSFTSVYDDEWHFLAASYDGTTLRVWVDGVLENQQDFGPGDANDAPLALGGRLDLSQPLLGTVDDIGLFNVALEEDDLIEVMEEGLSSFLEPPAGGTRFRRGDNDGNGALEITDPINNLGYQFLGTFEPGCLDALDWDDNGTIEVTDPIGSLTRQFVGGAPAAPPGSEVCGEDPTGDALDCANYTEAACN
jgi:hypothetical protein